MLSCSEGPQSPGIALPLPPDPVVGESLLLQQVKRQVEKAQGLRLLLIGETGSGKTPLARYSNLVMGRGKPRAFEQVNCAALSGEHLNDQIFGHIRGAFTGASADKRGLVELARGGDLFLDEIGELPLETQALLLTFLDTLEYYPLGDDRKRKADVRIICATNCDLKAMVAAGRFRLDLYSRLSQVVIAVPALRQRLYDVRPLTEHFIREFTGSNKPYHPGILNVLEQREWREGNVRELRTVVEVMCTLATKFDRIELEHLPEPGLNPSARKNTSAAPGSVALVSQMGLESYLESVEKACLEFSLQNHEGSVESMALQLGMSRPTLYRRLKKYELVGRS